MFLDQKWFSFLAKLGGPSFLSSGKNIFDRIFLKDLGGKPPLPLFTQKIRQIVFEKLPIIPCCFLPLKLEFCCWQSCFTPKMNVSQFQYRLLQSFRAIVRWVVACLRQERGEQRERKGKVRNKLKEKVKVLKKRKQRWKWKLITRYHESEVEVFKSSNAWSCLPKLKRHML